MTGHSGANVTDFRGSPESAVTLGRNTQLHESNTRIVINVVT